MQKFQAKIKITLKEGILDVQGKAVEHALGSIEFPMMNNVRIGKYVTLDIEAENEKKAHELTKDACNKLIANPVIENFEIEIISK